MSQLEKRIWGELEKMQNDYQSGEQRTHGFFPSLPVPSLPFPSRAGPRGRAAAATHPLVSTQPNCIYPLFRPLGRDLGGRSQGLGTDLGGLGSICFVGCIMWNFQIINKNIISGKNRKSTILGQNLLKSVPSQSAHKSHGPEELRLHLMLETELGSVTITQVILVLKVWRDHRT